MTPVCVESPFKGDIETNVLYAEACMLDALERGEAPFLGHLLFPRVYSDHNPAQRERGIRAHIAWLRRAAFVAVYTDRGVTDGMQAAIDVADEIDMHVVRRRLGPDWMTRFAAQVCRTEGFR